MFYTASNLCVGKLNAALMAVGTWRLCSCMLVLTLTISRWGWGGVGRGCRCRGRGLGWGWSLIVIRCSEDVHATGRTGLLSLEPGAQAAVGTKGG